MTLTTASTHDPRDLDALTGGAFSAPTSGERAARVREWLAREPSAEQMQEVFKELSGRDKGAARLLRERLDEIKRAKGQEAIAAEWAQKAQGLLDAPRLNIADALAWQRDAARAGAPLSREPLAGLKQRLAERVKGIEDLQHRVQVQREAAVLLAQRIEVLSTKSWKDAVGAAEALAKDVPDWQAQAEALPAEPHWASVDARFPPLLEASKAQLQAVWEAFRSALAQAQAAETEAAAPLPPVPVWADELRAARGLPPEAPPKPAKPKVDPAVREKANHAVREALSRVEKEVAEGHGKASAGAAAALRNALKEHGRLVDDKLENEAHAALAAAGELEGWQRWRADQLRQELVAKAEALFETAPPPAQAAPSARGPRGSRRSAASEGAAAQAVQPPAGAAVAAVEAAPSQDVTAQAPLPAAPVAAPDSAPESAAVPSAEAVAQDAAQDAPVAQAAPEAPAAQGAPAVPAGEPRPRFGGRKMQEQLRALREQWKQVDQGGVPNHALWKRFDEACNRAYKVVEAWLDKVKSEAAEHRASRLALIAGLRDWASAQGDAPADLKAHARAVHQFENRWREAGHLSEKAFAELQPQWREALQAARAPLDAAQKQSTERRQAMIAEAEALGAAPQLRIDAVKALQQRWQAEAQAVPMDRKHEQKLWDAFRKPIDEAFQRKGQDRDRAAAALSERDRAVLDASRGLEAANASGDAQKIKAAMAALEAALRGQAQARAEVAAAGEAAAVGASAPLPSEEGTAGSAEGAAEAASDAEAARAPAAPPKPRPVVAMRGDDRPGMKKSEPVQAGRGGRFGDRKGGPGAGRPGERGGRPGDMRGGFGGGRFGDRPEREDRGPRLGDVAFRAQRDALEHAQAALRKLAAQAHGEALAHLLSAWEQRNPEQVPGVQEFGKGVSPAVRSAWLKALGSAPAGDAGEAMLRLEIASEVPTPADQLDARRALQLKLLTRRNDPSPAQTWGEDTARVLAAAHDAALARRLQKALGALLRG